MCHVMLGAIVIFGNPEVITTGQKDNTPRITEEEDKWNPIFDNIKLLEQPWVHLPLAFLLSEE